MNWTAKHSVVSGLLLIAGVNAIALAGVYYNRSGTPDSTLRFSERELMTPYEWRGRKENSGISLDLRWRVLPPDKVGETGNRYYYGTTPFWLDDKKMLSLGFDLKVGSEPKNLGSTREHSETKDLYLVLELDGPAYKESLRRVENDSKTEKDGREKIAEERERQTRLFVVDAGLEPAILRKKFQDRNRYAIARGQIRTVWQGDTGNFKLTGAISELSVSSINVPFELRSVFEGAGEYDEDKKKSRVQYQVDVSFGQRFEPWITMASRKGQ
jgi:hypothetical protein